MTPYQPSLSMCDDHSHQHEDTFESLDEFLAPFLADIPGAPLPTAITTPSPPSPPSGPSTSVPASAAAYYAPGPQLICQWVSMDNHSLICGTPLSTDAKQVCTHFRHAHDVRGNEKVIVGCFWRNCQALPMQRGSLLRHVLAVHLGLLRWRCEACGRVFSRRGTLHACGEGE
ncbi:hypothetical protein HD554DRAFT_306556 [Boletus coccyginus]|nr:hypothetical protein HD554DRAFT_306556 [Boletus coccyginus]